MKTQKYHVVGRDTVLVRKSSANATESLVEGSRKDCHQYS